MRAAHINIIQTVIGPINALHRSKKREPVLSFGSAIYGIESQIRLFKGIILEINAEIWAPL